MIMKIGIVSKKRRRNTDSYEYESSVYHWYLGDVPEEQEDIFTINAYGAFRTILGKIGKKQPIGLMRHTLNRILRVQPPKYK